MILTEFDNNKLAMFNATNFQKKRKDFPEIVVGFFHHDLISEFVKLYKPKQIAKINSCTKDFEIYLVNIDGTEIAVTQAPLGAPYCVSIFEEIIALGAKKIILCGSCGCLDSSIADYSIIIPTSAIRDEGTSYHYAPESDEIELDKNIILSFEKTLSKLKIPYFKGKTWTTDALYRETSEKVAKRKSQGAIVVDMECSAMAAFASFRDIEFGQIFYGADDLSQEKYDVRSLIDGEISKQAKIIPVTLKCAQQLSTNNS